MLASLTPDGKRKFPFETESTNYERSDQLLRVRLSVTDGDLVAPSSKRPCQIEMHNSQQPIPMAVQEQENTYTEMEIVDSEEITTTTNKLLLHETRQNINHKQFVSNNDNVSNSYEMVAQNLCTRCQAGESGHIKHIFH